nr:uncharacterized protein LOC111512558 [Leptinotarsa decemlineata]
MEEKKEYFENISRILDRALKVNNKTEEDLKENIMIVKKWVKTQPHLPEMPDDHTITSFLIMNKFSVENVKQKIGMYYTMRSLYPDYFENKHPLSPCMQHTMDKIARDNNIIPRSFLLKSPIPGERAKRILERARRVLIRSQINYHRWKRSTLMQDVTERFEEIRRETLEDYHGKIFAKIEKSFTTKFLGGEFCFQKVFNNNIKQIHLLNYPPFAEPVLNLTKKLLNPKIAQRITLHKSTDTIKDYISKDILPKDYGGTGPSLREYSEIWKQKFTEYKGRFDTLDTLRVNEKLRPSPLINDEVLGYYGHFKKVDID